MYSADTAGASADWVVPGYRHERLLGTGASGRVMLARHDATGTAVAIKYLVRPLYSAEDFCAAYRVEAELLGELQSPHVVRLYEYVEGEYGAAIVMELVEGLSLRELLRAEGATTPEAALVVLKGSLLGLAAAHGAGVVHRDYKPENVLVTPQGLSKLVDFGIATRSGTTPMAAGTPLYMAPEQFAGQSATPAADVYAATATFFECITGAKPYSGTTVMELMIQHSQAPIPDELAPAAVRPLIRAGLAKAPEERPASAAVFVDELEEVALAAYGADWEERGQRKLAAVAAMLPLLLLRTQGVAPSGTTALATTTLGRGAPEPDRPKTGHAASKAILAVTAIVLLGLIVAVASGLNINTAGFDINGGGGQQPVAAAQNSTSGAITTVGPTPPTVPPSVLASPSASASPTPSASADPTPTTTPSPVLSTPTTIPTTPSASPSPSPSPSASASSTLRVIDVLVSNAACYSSTALEATVSTAFTGSGPGTLILTWFYTESLRAVQPITIDTESIPLSQVGSDVSTIYHYDFDSASTAGYWGVTVSTNPAATRDNDTSTEIEAESCQPPVVR
jgi:serine/threonine protein kinase